jgi:hypothetical protein
VGQTGGDSYVYVTASTYIVYADGGYGAGTGTTPNSGSGGHGNLCTGSIIYDGGDGYTSTDQSGSAGGDCYVGGCGGIKNPYVSSSLSSSWFGYAGEFPGGGGGGASSFSSSFRVDGGIGGNGQVIIEW